MASACNNMSGTDEERRQKIQKERQKEKAKKKRQEEKELAVYKTTDLEYQQKVNDNRKTYGLKPRKVQCTMNYFAKK